METLSLLLTSMKSHQSKFKIIMNLKIALTTVILISGGSLASQAQQKSASAKIMATSEAKSFASKIAAYEKEKDAAKAATLFSDLKQEMANGMGSLKTEIVNESSKGDKAAMDRLIKKNEVRATALTQANQLANTEGADKQAIIKELKKYAQTL